MKVMSSLDKVKYLKVKVEEKYSKKIINQIMNQEWVLLSINHQYQDYKILLLAEKAKVKWDNSTKVDKNNKNKRNKDKIAHNVFKVLITWSQ